MDLLIRDSTATGVETARLLLHDVTAPTSLRELITLRVREEVARMRATSGTQPTWAMRLVEPTGHERALNPVPVTAAVPDWETQAAVALAAFESQRFFVFVSDRQLEHLDDPIALTELDAVSFVRLVPLAGG